VSYPRHEARLAALKELWYGHPGRIELDPVTRCYHFITPFTVSVSREGQRERPINDPFGESAEQLIHRWWKRCVIDIEHLPNSCLVLDMPKKVSRRARWDGRRWIDLTTAPPYPAPPWPAPVQPPSVPATARSVVRPAARPTPATMPQTIGLPPKTGTTRIIPASSRGGSPRR